MYGLVNQAVEELIRTQHGDDTWEIIKAKAGMEEPAFVSMSQYPDDLTYRLVGAASAHLDVPASDILEAFGEYWTLYTAKHGFGEILGLAGHNFVDFVQNLDHMHAHVALSFPELRPPSFWCTDVTADSLRLHYRTDRAGLAPTVVGMLRGLGKMFDTKLSIEHVADRAAGADHDEFQIHHAPIA